MQNSVVRGVVLYAVLAGLAAVPGAAADEEESARFSIVFGPRIGAIYVATSPDDFTDTVRELGEYDGEYLPVLSLFGLNIEERVLLGDTESHFAFQQLIYIAGIEQAISIPGGAFLVGFRGGGGIEFGVGPVATAAGLGMIIAGGYTFETRGVYIPIDVSVVLPNQTGAARISITTGFNFVIDAQLNL